jgi:elongation factor Ts
LAATVDTIKALRGLTGAGIMDCKRALEEANGDLEQAQAILRERGTVTAAKKASRATSEGVIEQYLHSGGQVGAMVEVDCESDFVARTPEFKTLAHDLAMQVAAMAPLYVDTTDIPDGDEVDPEEVCLLRQPFIKDTTKSVQDQVNEAVARLGENIRVRRFTRFSIG